MKVALVVAAVLAGGFVIGLSVLGGGTGGSAASTTAIDSLAEIAAQTCDVSGAVAGLDAERTKDADLIVSAAMAATDENQAATRVAVMVALAESGLRDLDGGDRDSLGLFQQRPSQGWGTPAQLLDPTYATDAFVRRLLAVPGWQAMPPWQAAQTVQRSAFADGSNYHAKWSQAGQIVAAVAADGDQPGACGQGSGPLATTTSAHGLPAGYAIPAGTPPKHQAVVEYALAQLGKPYVWGASGPASFDCSGLTMAAWASVGVNLAHYTGDQQREGAAVTAASLTPGDLVLVPGSDPPAPGVAGHVGIYLGDGLVLSAIDPQLGVAVQTWSTFVSGGLTAMRDPAPGA